MPLWNIYHPEGTFEDKESKQALSKDITKIYHEGPAALPKFYVIVNFIKLPQESTYIGGEPNTSTPFIRLKIDQIAVRLPNDDKVYNSMTSRVDAAIKPHIADKGYDWEFHIDETERRLWKVQGFIPPPNKSEGEKLWRDLNKAVPWDEESK
jgi:phenylpyruvate tautomerase PptA (4-oxalocrotonate tautomerase family)